MILWVAVVFCISGQNICITVSAKLQVRSKVMVPCWKIESIAHNACASNSKQGVHQKTATKSPNSVFCGYPSWNLKVEHRQKKFFPVKNFFLFFFQVQHIPQISNFGILVSVTIQLYRIIFIPLSILDNLSGHLWFVSTGTMTIFIWSMLKPSN